MNLLPSAWRQISYLTLLSGIALAVSSCAPLPKLDTLAKTVEKSPALKEVVAPRPLTAELVYYLLSAEIAGQRGQVGLASELYNKAANKTDSPAVAGRSAQIANYTRDKKRINRALDRWVNVAPEDADVHIMRIPFLLMQSKYTQATSSIDLAIKIAPEKTQAYLITVADSLSELTQEKQALALIESLEIYKDNHIEAFYIYARLAGHYKQYDKALHAIETVLKQDKTREEAVVLKAEILQLLGKGQEALSTLKPLARRQSANHDTRFSYAKLLGENGKLSDSYQIFERLHQAYPNDEETLFALGLLSLEEKKGDQAKQYFNRLIKLGDKGQQAHYFMGVAEELNNDVDAALLWFSSVPVTSSRFQSAQSSYINLLADNGQLAKARLHLKLLRKENPDKTLQYYLFEADFLCEQAQFQAAFDLYSEVLTSHPNNIDLLYGRAMVAEPLNRLSVLIDDFTQILELDPNNHIVLNALGYTLTDRTDQHQRALTLIKKALDLKPNDPFYLDSLGWVYYRLNQLDNAERYLKQAVVLQDDSEFLAHLGEVLWERGKQAQAKKVWLQGFKKDKDNRILNDTMRRFGE